MRLFIAEKPSLARAIAEVLPGPQKRARLHIECAAGDVVAWCAGHILEMAPPDAYGNAYKSWRLESLPITPTDWKLEVSSPELLASIRRLLRSATRVVHAGDPDREGQLLVDEVLHFLGYRGPVDRLLVRDLSPEAVRRQLGALEPNAKYRALYESALARQRADWLYGMNMTRLYTLLGRGPTGQGGVLSVGRVQTPLLGLIVARDRAIAEFQPVPYYVVAAEMRGAGGGETFRAVWVPGPGAELDPEGRLLSREVADEVRGRVCGQEGSVAECGEERKTEAPPLPYSLADLQVDAGRRARMTAAEVQGACQSLYETHRLLTYPRSDCPFLPEGQRAQAREVLAAIGRQAPAFRPAIAKADLTLRSRAWNDKKVSAHHGIVPTPAAGASAPVQLTAAERAVYELVGRRYLAQFYAPHEFLQTRAQLEIAGERFTATGRRVLALGWKALAQPETEEDSPDGEPAAGEKEKEAAAPLPPLRVGDAVSALDVTVASKRTASPKSFNDASLIAAMCGVAKFVRDPAVKKILTEADGIGTPATRAAILETLFERGYVARAGRTIVSTETGRALIASLPEVATTPELTATWEAALRAITDGRQTLDAFLGRVGAHLGQLVAEGRALGRIAVPPAAPAPPPARGRSPRKPHYADAHTPNTGRQRRP
jgi:DNA topoisomerase-3